MSRSDAEVLEAMRDRQLEEYYLKQSPSDNYDECFEKIDSESAEFCQKLVEMVKTFSDKYKIAELDILKYMIYPTLEAGVTA